MIDVEMPQMGESIVEGTLTKWLKKPGDKVERDEPLFEISTDKVDTEIPSPVAGTLAEILVEEGKTVGINTVVGRISDGAASSPSGSAAPVAASAPAQVPAPQATVAQSDGASHVDAAPQAAPAPAAAQDTGTVVEETAGPLSPLVRKMARENNIDLSRVKGTGVGGRITKQDLEAYLTGQTTGQTTGQAGTAVAPVSAPRPVQAPPPQQAPVHVPAPAP